MFPSFRGRPFGTFLQGRQAINPGAFSGPFLASRACAHGMRLERLTSFRTFRPLLERLKSTRHVVFPALLYVKAAASVSDLLLAPASDPVETASSDMLFA